MTCLMASIVFHGFFESSYENLAEVTYSCCFHCHFSPRIIKIFQEINNINGDLSPKDISFKHVIFKNSGYSNFSARTSYTICKRINGNARFQRQHVQS